MLRTGEAPLSFEEFWQQVCEAMSLESTEVGPDTALQADLGFDSLAMAELVLFMDTLDCDVPEGLIPSLVTIGDFYDHYCTRTSAQLGSPR
jgi:acyl carrier protein